MLDILFSWLSIPRMIGIWIDSIAFSLIDNAYNLIVYFASNEFFDIKIINDLKENVYVIIFMFALFRLALLLVNSLINPEKLTDSNAGLGKIAGNVVIMFGILIITPFIFRTSREIQAKVVEKNYIGNIFGLGIANFNPDESSETNAGDLMKKIAVGALIYPDERLYKDGTFDPSCNSNCQEAINKYNEMMKGDYKVDFGLLSTYATVSVDYYGEKVYAYNYLFIVTLVVGCFITYILLSFAIDIAVRTVELFVLEVLSPIFITTYIDPKSAKSGPFHNWLTTVGKTYVSLYIKLAIVSIMLMLISLINNETSVVPKGGGMWGFLFLMLGILIFAKKAPKWIMGLIGMKGEEGLGGLSIGKKLAGAALVGGVATKAGRALGGAATGLAKAGYNQARNRHAQRKDIRQESGLKHGKEARDRVKEYKKQRQDQNQGALKSYFGARKDLYKDRHNAYKEQDAARTNIGTALKQGAASMALGAAYGAKTGYGAENLKGAFKGSIAASDKLANELSLKGEGIGDKIRTGIGKADQGLRGAYGDTIARNEAIEAAQKNKKVQSWQSKDSRKDKIFTSGMEEGQLVAGQGAFNKLLAQKSGDYKVESYEDALAVQYMANKGGSNLTFDSVAGKYKFTSKDGVEMKVSQSDLKGNLGGLIDPTSAGMTEFQKMWNSYATSQVNNYVQNAQTAAQITSTIQQGILNKTAMTNDIISSITPDLSIPGVDKSTLKLQNTADINEFKGKVDGAMETVKTKLASLPEGESEERGKLESELNLLNAISGKCASAESVIKSTDAQIDSLSAQYSQLSKAQEKIQGIYDKLEGTTAAEKTEKLSLAKDKIDKTLAYFEQKKDNKK